MSLSHKATSALELNVQLSEKYAALTFPQRELKEYGGGHRELGNAENLKAVQSKTHPGISEQQFVRPFYDGSDNSQLRHQMHEAFESAFASMSHYGFATHKAVLLRPDDFHLLIIQGFARFLQQYPEDFRESVVSFTGKKQIKIFGLDPTNLKDWDHLPKGFAGLVKQYLSHPELADTLLQAYSDSTPSDATAKAITLMGTFSAYFCYAVSTMCYIPKFILQGTVEDWEKLANLPNQILSTLKLADNENQPQGLILLNRWLTRLQPVVDKMLNARNGVADAEFWNGFYKFHSHSGASNIAGHFIYFYPFLKNTLKSTIMNEWGQVTSLKNNDENLELNQYILGTTVTLGLKNRDEGPTSSELPANIIHVDFKLEDRNENNETIEYNMGMKAGIVTFKESVLQELKDESALRTHVDYSIFFKDKTLPAKKMPRENKLEDANAMTATDNSKAIAQPTKTSNPNQVFAKKKITFELETEEPQVSNTFGKQ